MARNQQAQPKGREPQPGRPKLTNIKSPLPSKASPGEKPGKKGGKKMMIFVLLLLVLAGGGFFGYRHWRQPGQKRVPVVTSGPQTTYTLKAITVNLADAGHFLRIEVVLQYPASDAALTAELKDREYVIDDHIISDLRAKTYGELATDQGESALKQELLHTVNGVVTKGKISGIYFDDFLIQ